MATATGRVSHPARALLLVVEGHWRWYKRNWRSSITSTFLQPALYLVALGFGFGSQVQPGPATLGLSYVQYLAPALLVASLLQMASFDSTYPVLSGFKWQQNYVAVASTPITPGQVMGGQLVFIAARLTFAGLVFVVVAAALGGISGAAALWAVPIGVLTAMALAAPVVAFSATLQDEGQSFNFIFRFIVLPMTLFAGTFFPVDQLPVLVRPLAWATPLWHGTELARGAAFGTLDPLPALGHLAYLGVFVAVGVHLARRNFVRRLAV